MQPEPCRRSTRLKPDEVAVITLPDGTQVLVWRDGRNMILEAPESVKVERR